MNQMPFDGEFPPQKNAQNICRAKQLKLFTKQPRCPSKINAQRGDRNFSFAGRPWGFPSLSIPLSRYC